MRRRLLMSLGLALGIFAFFIACNDDENVSPVPNPSQGESENPDRFEELQNTWLYVLLPGTTFDRIVASREEHGEAEVPYYHYIDSSYFDGGTGVDDENVYQYVGYVGAIINGSELLQTDSVLYHEPIMVPTTPDDYKPIIMPDTMTTIPGAGNIPTDEERGFRIVINRETITVGPDNVKIVIKADTIFLQNGLPEVM